MRKPKLITLDTETYYSKEYSLTKLTTEAYIRDPRFQIIGVSVKVGSGPATWHSHATLQEYRDLLAPILEGNCLLCHNTAFDGSILGWRLGLHPPFMFDTLSMARPANQMSIGVSLKALADKYTVGQKGTEVVLALGKRLEDFTTEELYRYGEYCKNDVDLTYLLFHILRQEFPPAEMRIIDLLLKMYTNPVLELDVPVLEAHLSHVQERKAAALKSVNTLCSKEGLMSNSKLADVLRGLGVDPPMKTSPTKGKPTYAFSKTDVGFKELLEHDNPEVQAVVTARLGVKSTIEETRTLSFLDVATRGKLPVPLKYYGAHTGRVSAAEGSRLNMTNLTRGGELRRAVIAPKGYSLVICDSSQIEARIVAWLAGQNDLVSAFAMGEDIYSQFASKVYGRPVDRKRKEEGPDGKLFAPDEVEGFVGKTCILGLGFGLAHEKFALQLKSGKTPVIVLPEESMRIVRLYRNTMHMIVRLWKTCDKALLHIYKGEKFVFGANGVLETCAEGIKLPNGMIVRYPNLTMQHSQGPFGLEYAYAGDRRQLAAWTTMNLTDEWDLNKLTRIYGAKVTENVTQALARIVVMDQMLAISKRYRPVHTVYDDIAICVPDEEVEEAKAFMLDAMSVAPDWAPGLPIACEVGAGKNYADAK